MGQRHGASFPSYRPSRSVSTGKCVFHAARFEVVCYVAVVTGINITVPRTLQTGKLRTSQDNDLMESHSRSLAHERFLTGVRPFRGC